MTSNRFFFALFFIICVSVAQANERFRNFIAHFKEAPELNDSMFVASAPWDFGEEEDSVLCFLPQLPLDNECEMLRWNRNGAYVKQSNGTLLLIAHCTLFGIEDGFAKWLTENNVSCCVAVIYNSDGRIIDSAILAQTGSAYRNRITTKGKTIVAEQGVLTDGAQLRQYSDLTFDFVRKTFCIDKRGKIVARQEPAGWKEIVPQVDTQPRSTTFPEFLSLFEPWSDGQLNERVFSSSKCRIIDYPAVAKFIPNTLDCNCYPRDVDWIPGHYIEQKDHVYCFVLKECKRPLKGDRYADYIVLKYTRNGNLLSARIIATEKLDSDADHIRLRHALLGIEKEVRAEPIMGK